MCKLLCSRGLGIVILLDVKKKKGVLSLKVSLCVYVLRFIGV